MQTTEDFLRCMWPSEGNKLIVGFKDGKPKVHCWFQPDKIKDAATKALELSAKGFDVYYALAGFSGKERKQDQVVALKSLWMDIDVGKDNCYETRIDAIRSLGTFIKQLELPTPIIVASGIGLHTYYPLDRTYSIAEWQPLANALKELTIQHGFKADFKITADAARILRPIGTLNYKNGTPHPVYIANKDKAIYVDPAQVIGILQKSQQTDIFQKIQQEVQKPNHQTFTGFDSQIPADFNDIIEKCATVRWGYDNQALVQEPFWYDLLGVAGFCDDPDGSAQDISRRHPEYDQASTTTKYQQRIRRAGPTTCAQFQQNPQSKCTGCPHKITTPLQLGRPKNVIYTTTPINGGERFKDNSLKLDDTGFYANVPTTKDKDGNQYYDWVKVGRFGLCPLLEFRQPDASGTPSNFVWLEVYDHLGKSTRSFNIPSQGIANSTLFSGECAKQGYYFESESAPVAYKRFHRIMRSWVEQLKFQHGNPVLFKSFGWVGAEEASSEEKRNSFLLGNTLYTEAGGKHLTPSLPTLSAFQQDLVSKGDLDVWVKTMDHYNLPGMEAQMFATWIAWGSPLMCFTNSGTLVFHIIGETGVGKTSLQRSIISTYGDYNSKLLLDVNSSTINSMGKTMGLLNSLPYCKEELTEAAFEDLASWSLTATQGREKQRMNQYNGIAQVATWNMIACTSANQSLREIIITQRHDSAARLARVWEQELQLPMRQFEASQLFAPLKKNYGRAGEIYIEYIVRNQTDIKDLIMKKEEELSKRLKGDGQDRFHISMLTANIVGATIAKQLGLTNHDIPRGVAFAIRQFKVLKGIAKKEKHTPEENLIKFMQDNQPITLVVEIDNPSSTNVTVPFSSGNNILHAVGSGQSIHLRYSTQSRMFYATTSLIRKWYVDNHINFESDMKHLEKLGILTERNKRVVLTKGTKMGDNKQVWATWFDLSKSTEFIDI